MSLHFPFPSDTWAQEPPLSLSLCGRAQPAEQRVCRTASGLARAVAAVPAPAYSGAWLFPREPHPQGHPQPHAVPSPRGGCTRNGESPGQPPPPPGPARPGRAQRDRFRRTRPPFPSGGQGSTPRGAPTSRPGRPAVFLHLPGHTLHAPPRVSSAGERGPTAEVGAPRPSRRPPRDPHAGSAHARARALRPGVPEADWRWAGRRWAPRRVMPGGARRFSHLRERIHRPGLRVSISRRWRRWFKVKKRKEVSPGSGCRWEKTRGPGPGRSPQPALLSPAASGVGLGLRLPFKFEFQRRQPRACVGGGWGAAPGPGAGSRGPGGRAVPRVAPPP